MQSFHCDVLHNLLLGAFLADVPQLLGQSIHTLKTANRQKVQVTPHNAGGQLLIISADGAGSLWHTAMLVQSFEGQLLFVI